MIWKHAIRVIPGRHIVLRYTPPLISANGWSLRLNEIPIPLHMLTVPQNQLQPEITSCAQIPAVLHACHLSRHLSKERWALSLGGYAAAEKKVYVDVRTDVVYFPNGTILAVWCQMGDWADVLKFVDGWVFVVRNGDLQNAILNTIPVRFSYRTQMLTLSITIEQGYVVLLRHETD